MDMDRKNMNMNSFNESTNLYQREEKGREEKEKRREGEKGYGKRRTKK